MKTMTLKFSVMLFLALVQISGIVHTSVAQNTFEKTYGYDSLDRGHSVKQTLDGGYIIVGYTVNYLGGLGHDYVIRLNSIGDTLWTRSYGTQYFQSVAYSVQLTNDGGFIIAGYAQLYSGDGYLYLVKTDDAGDTAWTKKINAGFDYTCGYAVQQTLDGGYIVCGREVNYSMESNILLVKTDANGNEQWTKTYGGADVEIGYNVTRTLDKGYIIVGGSLSYGITDWDFYVVKTDSSGNLIWENHYGDSGEDIAFSVKPTTDGGYAILGSSTKIVQNKYLINLFLVKINSNGDTLWTKKYLSNVNCEYYSLDLGCDGGFILAGAKFDSVTFNSDAYLIKTDETGNVIWSKTFGGIWRDGTYSVEHLNDGYITTGYSEATESGTAGQDVYVIKISCNGEFTNVDELIPQSVLYSIAPNPFSQSTLIKFNNQLEFDFSLYDILGKQVINQQRNSNQLTINRGILPAGVYFYNISSGVKTFAMGKLIIE